MVIASSGVAGGRAARSARCDACGTRPIGVCKHDIGVANRVTDV